MQNRNELITKEGGGGGGGGGKPIKSTPLSITHDQTCKRNCQKKHTHTYTTRGLAIYIKKYLNAKEELWKFKYFTMQKYNLQKNPLNQTKILQDIILTL